MSEENTIVEDAETTEVVEAEVVEAQVSEAPATQEAAPTQEEKPAQEPRTINLDAKTAFSLKLIQFDRDIAEAESKVADLKKNKASYVYDTNLQEVLNADMQQKIKAETEKKIQEEYQKNLAKADSSS